MDTRSRILGTGLRDRSGASGSGLRLSHGGVRPAISLIAPANFASRRWRGRLGRRTGNWIYSAAKPTAVTSGASAARNGASAQSAMSDSLAAIAATTSTSFSPAGFSRRSPCRSSRWLSAGRSMGANALALGLVSRRSFRCFCLRCPRAMCRIDQRQVLAGGADRRSGPARLLVALTF